MNYYQSYFQNVFAGKSTIFVVSNIVIVISTMIIVFAILIDFVIYHKPKEAKKQKHSWVETGTMFVFFFVYYLLMHVKSGRIVISSTIVDDVICLIGTLLISSGCIVNVLGRFSLKDNWANQVTIYPNQSLVTVGVYKLARHPLYASIIWMLMGGSLVYLNYLAMLAVLAIFVPMMRFRAKQEETLLQAEFPEYMQYKNKVWMFSPKFIKIW